MSTLVIGEMGSTAEGNLDTMKRLVDCAADCKCDVVKNQWVSNAQTMCDRRRAPEYLESYALLQYPLDWHAELRAHAKARGLQYGCSVYIGGDPTLIAPFVDYIKISSFESADDALIGEAIATGSEVVVSLGMAGDATEYGLVQYLHCVSSYPSPLSALNLRCLGDESDCDGFSDHSHDVRVGAWAVAAGASILETHFRLDSCNLANKDYAVAFTPAEFKEYIRNVRDCEMAMGDGVQRVQEAERPMLRYRVTA